MKAKTAVILLAVLCVILAVVLVWRHQTAVKQKEEDDAALLNLSNQLSQTSARLKAATEDNEKLSAKLNAKTAEFEQTSAQLAQTRADLAMSQADAKTAKDGLAAAQAKITELDARIVQLQDRNAELDKQASDLQAAIVALQGKIADTEQKLARSEGDREFLLKELKRLQTEKADLERKFNDLVALREQFKKLKDELAVFRRLEWIRQGLYGPMKNGAELLQTGLPRPAAPTPATNVDLNYEVRRDGTATILAPVTGPPGTAPPK